MNAYSVDFDGANDYATATLGSAVFDGDFSLSFWARPDTSSDSYHTLMQLGSYSGGWRLYRYPGQTSGNMFAWWKGQGGYANIFGNFGTAAADAWFNLAIVRNGSTSKAYINGSEVASATDSHSYTSTALDITFTAYPFPGLMDEIALWDSALSASNVTAVYNSGTPTDISSLSPVNWWRMGDNDGGSGATITDQGSASNNVALKNGPTFSTTVPS